MVTGPEPAGMEGDLEFASTLEAASAIRTRKVSSRELTELMLRRIETFNPRCNAIATVGEEAALSRAREADEALARSEIWGPLHGVPCTVKDTLETAGVRTTAGSPLLGNYVPRNDATVVARLKAAGAVILGKTNVPLLAGDWQTYNDLFGCTRNPWDGSRTAGGSTGGGAAAVAAGLGYLTLGSDVAGSIRFPAHCCGVYGHKPSLGVVPLHGHVPPVPPMPSQPLAMGVGNLVAAGPLSRSAADLMAAMEVLGGPDAHDAIAYRWSLPPPRQSRLADYRVGYVLDDRRCPVTGPLRSALEDAVVALRKAGVKLEEGWPPDVDPEDQFETYRYLLYSVTATTMPAGDTQRIRLRAAMGDAGSQAFELARTAPHGVFLQADGKRRVALAAWQNFFRTHDAFLLPTAFVTAFPHDHSAAIEERVLTTPEGSYPYMDLLFWTSMATLNGLPATVAPIGLTRDGMPAGLQIVGPYLEDATPIDIADRMADAVGGFRRPPGY